MALLPGQRGDAVVLYPAERDVPAWTRHHDSGLVPGAWPYGLDRLATPELTATWGHLPEEGPLEWRVRRVLDYMPRRRDAGETKFTWDENAALRVVGRRAHGRHLSGVIWLTDHADTAPRRSVSAIRRCDALWVLSDAQVDPLRRIVGSSGPPVLPVGFGVDHEFFRVRPWPTTPMVLSVGGDRDRDVRTLFETLEAVHRRRPDVRLLVQTPHDVPAPAGVEVLPRVDHVTLRELYSQASVVVIATRPNLHVSGMTVSLEARATGRPVVITRTPGMSRYLTPGTDSLMAPTGAASELARAVLDLLDDEGAAQQMGRAGRSSVETRHTQDTMAADLRAVLRAAR